mgnify:CR=1 FL=1
MHVLQTFLKQKKLPEVSSGKGNYLNIGKYVHICGNTLIACAGGVEINDFSSVAQGVRIYSRSDDFSGKTLTNGIVPSSLVKVVDKAITIDRHVIIGANAVILPGVSIGEGTAVGALSLIKDNLDAWSIYAGTPAKKIGQVILKEGGTVELSYFLQNE